MRLVRRGVPCSQTSTRSPSAMPPKSSSPVTRWSKRSPPRGEPADQSTSPCSNTAATVRRSSSPSAGAQGIAVIPESGGTFMVTAG